MDNTTALMIVIFSLILGTICTIEAIKITIKDIRKTLEKRRTKEWRK